MGFRPDIVIGNPPYNKGSDVDFIYTGFHLSKHLTVMITPAKWQTSDQDQRIASHISYGTFRKEIVPYMDKMVYYINSDNVFKGVQQIDGITYYRLNKDTNPIDRDYKCSITNICTDTPDFNSTSIRTLVNEESLFNIGSEVVNTIENKLGKLIENKTSYQFPKLTGTKKYKVYMNTKMSGFNWFSGSGVRYVTGISRIITNNNEYTGESKCIFESDNEDECYSYMSWLYSKPVRFLVLINVSKLNNINTNHYFRFVPDKTIFDHIFTDDELYEEYGIQQYKPIIDRVIKTRDIYNMKQRD
jgi:hypothetical protein